MPGKTSVNREKHQTLLSRSLVGEVQNQHRILQPRKTSMLFFVFPNDGVSREMLIRLKLGVNEGSQDIIR